MNSPDSSPPAPWSSRENRWLKSKPKSVRKKMKDKAFARNVHREDIIEGAADLGVDLEEHIAFCIEAMKTIARELGLDGSAVKSA